MAFLREEVLKDVISEVFETMFFADVDFEECEGEGGAFEYGSETCLENHDGCIILRMQISEKFARMITANFLGVDEAGANEIDEDDLIDSLRELANMVAGGCHAHANDSDWKLGIPRAWAASRSSPVCRAESAAAFGGGAMAITDRAAGAPGASTGTGKEDSTRTVCGLGFSFSGEPAGSAALEYLPG